MMAGILIISAICPYPADTGKKVVVSGMLEYLKVTYGVENVKYLYLGDDLPTDSHGTHYETFSLPTGLAKICSVIYHSLLMGKKSIQESILYSSSLRNHIHRYIREMDPDLIVYDTVRMGQFGYPEGYMERCILYMEDLFSVRYDKMLQSCNAKGGEQQLNALGNFAQHVPAPLRFGLKYAVWMERLLLTREKLLVWKSEASMPKKFRASLLLNEEEVELLETSTHANVKLMRPYLRLSPTLRQRNYDGNSTFVFLGVLNLPYNETGLLRFLEVGFPQVLDKIPDAKLRIIGRNPTERIINAVARFDGNVILEGYVEDLAGALATCCGMVVPLLFGSGIKIKVIEALSYGVPIVTTSIGTMGIPLQHGVHCYVEDDITLFFKWLVPLREVEHNNAMSDSALDLFDELFSKRAISASYAEFFRKF